MSQADFEKRLAALEQKAISQGVTIEELQADVSRLEDALATAQTVAVNTLRMFKEKIANDDRYSQN